MKFCCSKNKAHYDWTSLLNSHRRFVKKSHKVLEIGASNTERTKDLAGLCQQLIGVEFLSERTPRNFENIKYVVGDWQNLSDFIRPNSINIAVSSHTIEHVKNDLRAINELYTVLKPKGVALLNTPNRKRLTRVLIEKFTSERKFPFWEHIREYTEKDLIELLESSKFKEYKIKPVVFGIHGGSIHFYSESVPKRLRGLANFWEVHLFKE